MNGRGVVDTLVLENDESWVKFKKLLARAEAEGRIDGKYRCPVCGMRYNSEAECATCCVQVARAS